MNPFASPVKCVIRRAGDNVKPGVHDRLPDLDRRPEYRISAVLFRVSFKRRLLIYDSNVIFFYDIPDTVIQKIKILLMI